MTGAASIAHGSGRVLQGVLLATAGMFFVGSLAMRPLSAVVIWVFVFGLLGCVVLIEVMLWVVRQSTDPDA